MITGNDLEVLIAVAFLALILCALFVAALGGKR